MPKNSEVHVEGIQFSSRLLRLLFDYVFIWLVVWVKKKQFQLYKES